MQCKCAKIKRVAWTLANGFVCERDIETIKETVEPNEEISCHNQVRFVQSYCYLGHRRNATGGSEAAVTARTRTRWIKFRECEELLYGSKLSLKMKGKINQNCANLAILYKSETWCLRQNEMAM